METTKEPEINDYDSLPQETSSGHCPCCDKIASWVVSRETNQGEKQVIWCKHSKQWLRPHRDIKPKQNPLKQ